MKFGWIKDNGKDYFMGVTGAMLRDTVTPDGFKVGSDGAWQMGNVRYPPISGSKGRLSGECAVRKRGGGLSKDSRVPSWI